MNVLKMAEQTKIGQISLITKFRSTPNVVETAEIQFVKSPLTPRSSKKVKDLYLCTQVTQINSCMQQSFVEQRTA